MAYGNHVTDKHVNNPIIQPVKEQKKSSVLSYDSDGLTRL